MIEAVVSAGLLLVVMSFSLQMTYRVDTVWRDTGHHRVAIHELSNQLERLSKLGSSERMTELESLKVSEHLSATLQDAELTGEVVDDDWGQRLVLRLNWLRRHPGQPLQMSAWLSQENPITSSGPTDEPEAQP